jgi:hypothetical protein
MARSGLLRRSRIRLRRPGVSGCGANQMPQRQLNLPNAPLNNDNHFIARRLCAIKDGFDLVKFFGGEQEIIQANCLGLNWDACERILFVPDW